MGRGTWQAVLAAPVGCNGFAWPLRSRATTPSTVVPSRNVTEPVGGVASAEVTVAVS